jgi:hypothetical protein
MAVAEGTAYEAALEELAAVEGGSWPFLEEFRALKRVTEKTLQSLPEPQRERVRRILDRYAEARRGDSPTGCAPFAGLGDVLVVGGGGSCSYQVCSGWGSGSCSISRSRSGDVAPAGRWRTGSNGPSRHSLRKSLNLCLDPTALLDELQYHLGEARWG